MKRIWNYLDGKNWKAGTKYRVLTWLWGTAFALVGLGAWCILRIWALSTWEWMICFVGYPVLLSRIGLFLYACDHELHDGEAG